MRLLLLLLALAFLYPADQADEGLVGIVFGDVVTEGTTVKDVRADGPGKAAGIQVGDVITAIGGQSVAGMSSTQTLSLCRRPIGDTAGVDVLRAGKPMHFEVTWKPVPPDLLAKTEEAVKGAQGEKVDGWVEKLDGRNIGIVLAYPAGRAFEPGKTMVLVPGDPSGESTELKVWGTGKITRCATIYRVEAELSEGTTVHLWQRVVVVNPP